MSEFFSKESPTTPASDFFVAGSSRPEDGVRAAAPEGGEVKEVRKEVGKVRGRSRLVVVAVIAAVAAAAVTAAVFMAFQESSKEVQAVQAAPAAAKGVMVPDAKKAAPAPSIEPREASSVRSSGPASSPGQKAQPPKVASPKPKSTEPTLDERFAEQVRARCEKLAIPLICREKIRFEICNGRWSETPPAGEQVCLQHETNTNN